MKDQITNTIPVSEPVVFNIVNEIGYIVLNDPPENRMTIRFFHKLYEVVELVKKEDSLKGVIIHSSGRHFSSGADLNELCEEISKKSSRESHSLSLIEKNKETFHSIASIDIPVVAAVNGVCIGSALELALCADVRICEKNTTLGLPEVQFNLMPGCGGTVRLPLLTGMATALRLILTGDLFSADEASMYGVSDMVVPRKQSVNVAIDLIESATHRNLGKKQFREYVKSLSNQDDCL